jgi:cellulose synthase/poly-beta-1,6-N-acetylglucosamine synthase-like glycosyltransferase
MDADNVMAPDFLEAINKCLDAGYEAAQGLRASKNPEENWVARLDDAAEAVAFLEQRGRARLGLSARLSGSAMAFSESFFQAISRWQATCLSETAELMALAALLGFRIGWCPEAVSYDQKVSSVSQLSGQRHRWLVGEFEVFRRCFPRLVRRGVRDRDARKIEQALYLSRMLMPRNLLIAACAALLGLSLTGRWSALCLPWWLWASALVAHLLSFIAALFVQRSSWRAYAALLLSPLFVLVYVRAVLRLIRGSGIQVKTEHGISGLGGCA